MNKKNSLLGNIISDIPNSIKSFLLIISIIAISYIIAKYVPFMKPIEHAMLQAAENPDFFMTIFAVHLVMALICFCVIALAVLMVYAFVLLIANIIYFFVIETKISKLPDDYFTRYDEISPEELCSLLEVFQFNGHYLSKKPKFLKNNLTHIQYLMKSFTEEQANLVRHSKGGGYLYFRYKYDEEDGWILAY